MRSLAVLLAAPATMSLAVPVMHNYPRSAALVAPSTIQLGPLPVLPVTSRRTRRSQGERGQGGNSAAVAEAAQAPATPATAPPAAGMPADGPGQGRGRQAGAGGQGATGEGERSASGGRGRDRAAEGRGGQAAAVNAQAGAAAAVAGGACPAAAQQAPVQAAEGEAAAGEGEGDAAANELEVNAAFGDVVQLGGGNIKTDVLYPPSAAGAFEVEFQNADARVMRTTENKTPTGAPPAGFEALECSSFIVELAGGNDLTLAKIDYIMDPNNPAVAGRDLSTVRVGKLSAEGTTFVADDTIGELEFEAEENEVTLTVNDLNGEWGVFIPVAAAAAAPGAAAANGAAVAVDAAEQAKAAAAGEANVEAGAAAEAENETRINGTFNTVIPVNGAGEKTDILFPGGQAGEFEVEIKPQAANQVLVSTAPATGNPPAGFLFVDPNTFTVQTAAATNPATDTVKIDYFFSAATEATIDINQGVIGKLDPATNTFVTQGLGEFEIEAEEREWTLTTDDLNGTWAMLVPQSAVRQ